MATTRASSFATFWHLKFDRCDERRHAELTLSSLDTQTIALDVPTQEQVVNKRWMIQNSAVPAWKQFCRRPPKATNDWNEHAIAFLRTPRNGRTTSLCARDIAMRAKGGLLRRSGNEVGTSSGSALPPALPLAPPPLEPTPFVKRSSEQETEMTDATVEQHEELKRRM